MADSLQALQAEKTRLHGPQFNGISVLLDSVKMVLRIKDSRSTEQSPGNPDVNQAKLKHGFSVGSWHEYSVQESELTFTS